MKSRYSGRRQEEAEEEREMREAYFTRNPLKAFLNYVRVNLGIPLLAIRRKKPYRERRSPDKR